MSPPLPCGRYWELPPEWQLGSYFDQKAGTTGPRARRRGDRPSSFAEGYTWRMLVPQRLSIRQLTTSCAARLGGIGPIGDETEEDAANSDERPNVTRFEAELAIVGPQRLNDRRIGATEGNDLVDQFWGVASPPSAALGDWRTDLMWRFE